jgi:hypothetical protein
MTVRPVILLLCSVALAPIESNVIREGLALTPAPFSLFGLSFLVQDCAAAPAPRVEASSTLL